MSNVASMELSDELFKLSGWPQDKATGYSLGYLLRKLPRAAIVSLPPKYRASIYVTGVTDELVFDADTPEDAACKLAIELFKQGILTKGKG